MGWTCPPGHSGLSTQQFKQKCDQLGYKFQKATYDQLRGCANPTSGDADLALCTKHQNMRPWCI